MRRSLAGRIGGGDRPELDRLVVADGSKRPAVGAERHRPDTTAMPFENYHRLAASDIPDSDRAVMAPGSQRLAVGTEGHGIYPRVVPAKRGNALEFHRVPQVDGP